MSDQNCFSRKLRGEKPGALNLKEYKAKQGVSQNVQLLNNKDRSLRVNQNTVVQMFYRYFFHF